MHGELKRLEQEAVDVSSLAGVRQQLIAPTVIHHKDKGVRSLVACCLADLLRLYAPDAPFNQEELQVSASGVGIGFVEGIP